MKRFLYLRSTVTLVRTIFTTVKAGQWRGQRWVCRVGLTYVVQWGRSNCGVTKKWNLASWVNGGGRKAIGVITDLNRVAVFGGGLRLTYHNNWILIGGLEHGEREVTQKKYKLSLQIERAWFNKYKNDKNPVENAGWCKPPRELGEPARLLFRRPS